MIGGTLQLRAISFGIAVPAMLLLSCSGESPTVPEKSPQERTTTPDTTNVFGLIASEPLAIGNLQHLESSGSAGVTGGNTSYVSAIPGTFPGKDSVFVSNKSRPVLSVSAQLSGGGFDPLAIAAEAGDTLLLTVAVANGERANPLLVKVPSRRRPTIVRTTPPIGRVDVALNVHVGVVFSEPIDKSTVTDSSISLSTGGQSVAADVKIAEDGLSADLIPKNELKWGTTYELSVTEAIRDLNGDALAEVFSGTFRTAPEPEFIAFALANRVMFMIESTGQHLVSLGQGWSPAWMPGGRLLYLHRDCVECADVPWVRERNGNAAPLLPDSVTAGRDFSEPAPTLDGSRIALARIGGTHASPNQGENELLIITVKDLSIARVPLPAGFSVISRPSWSPNQSRIVFSCAKNADQGIHYDVDLCFVNADGSGFARYGRNDAWEWQPAWNPVTGVIAFTLSLDMGGDTWSYVNSISGEEGKDLADYGWGEGAAWSPDGKTLLYCMPPLIARNMATGSSIELYKFPAGAFMYGLAWGRM
jgi:hypothetical protein